MDGRPPVNVGVTSGGDIFGGIGGQLQRRAGRPAVQPVCSVDLAVPHAVALVSEPRAPLQLRDSGLLADAVLLRRRSRTSSTIRRSPATSTATSRSPRAPSAAERCSASGRSTGIGASRCSAGMLQYHESFNDPSPAGILAAVSVRSVRTAAAPLGHLHSAGHQLRPGDDGVPRIRPARRQHDARVL